MPQPRPAAKTKSAISAYPCYYLFYGSLCDAKVLARVLGKKAYDEATLAPSYRSAKIKGFEIKAWGQYTGLVESTDESTLVEGKVFCVQNEHAADRLCLYETTAYEVVGVAVEMGDQAIKGNVFKYAGNHKLLR